MQYAYSAENHDWDLTLHAAGELLQVGRALAKSSTERDLGFSPFTGSMLLSFCAIESYSASVAFCMSGDVRFKNFDFRSYREKSRFWDKLELVCNSAGLKVDKSHGLFQRIHQMQEWRNLVTHASPYKVPSTSVATTTGKAINKLHAPFQAKEYTRSVNEQSAKKYFETAREYIILLERTTGLKPRAHAAYTPVESENTAP